MKISIRKFESKDIPKKVEWINHSENNKYLHYDIPLKIEKTEKWFEKNKDRTDRFDAVIEADGVPCGTIGLLSIDQKNKKAVPLFIQTHRTVCKTELFFILLIKMIIQHKISQTLICDIFTCRKRRHRAVCRRRRKLSYFFCTAVSRRKNSRMRCKAVFRCENESSLI